MQNVGLMLFAVLGAGLANAQSLVQYPPEHLDVTQGQYAPVPDFKMLIDSPHFRGMTAEPTPHVAELEITYLGESQVVEPLASGELRQQVALKLNARDACNVLYVGWRFAPEQEISVQLKRNPTGVASLDCGVEGYETIKPIKGLATSLPRVVPGATHTMRVELNSRWLRVLIDGALAWMAPFDPRMSEVQGPIGLRTDNVAVELELRGEFPVPLQTPGAEVARSR